MWYKLNELGADSTDAFTKIFDTSHIETKQYYINIQRRKVKDFFIKFTKKSHFADFLTEQTLDFVLHRLFCGLAEMDTDDIRTGSQKTTIYNCKY